MTSAASILIILILVCVSILSNFAQDSGTRDVLFRGIGVVLALLALVIAVVQLVRHSRGPQ